MLRFRASLLFLAGACSSREPGAQTAISPRPDAATDDRGGANREPPRGDAGPYFGLGLNDATVLVPLARGPAAAVILRADEVVDDGTRLLPSSLVARIATSPGGR